MKALKIIFILALLGNALGSGLEARAEYSVLVNAEQSLDQTLTQIPHSDSYASLLTNVLSSSVFLLEESGGFSDLDPAKFSLYGDSWLHNDWRFNAFNISDPFFSGSASFSLPFGMLDSFSIQNRADARRHNSGILLRSDGQQSNRVSVRGDLGQTGDIVPFAIAIMDVFSGLHPRKRGFIPPKERRHQPKNFRVQAHEKLEIMNKPAHTAIELRSGTRRFLDFNSTTGDFENTFDENFTVLSAGLGLRPSPSSSIYVFAEALRRDHLFAELHHAKRETVEQKANTVFAGYQDKQFHLSAALKQFGIRHQDHEFVRELFDVDGEALFPFIPDGDYFGANLDFAYAADRFYLQLNERINNSSPKYGSWRNPLRFKGADYGQIAWQAQDATQAVGQHKLGMSDHVKLGALEFHYDLYLAHHHLLNRQFENTVAFFDAGLESELQWKINDAWQLFLSAGKSPQPLTAELARTLDPDFMNGQQTLSDGRLINTTGGTQISISKQLAPSNLYQTALGLSHRFNSRWTLNLQGLGRIFHQPYELRFSNGLAANGDFVDGHYFLSEGEKRYELVNTRSGQAFYWGGQIQIEGYKPNEYLVNIAFTAFNAIGYPSFGNGPTANDIGIVDYSSANPNTEHQRLAAVDGDRAFLFRAVLGKRLWRQLWGHLVISHRDGRPFSFFEFAEHEGQVALWNRSNRGSPLKFNRPLAGPREDFRLNFDASLRYTFEVSGVKLEADALVRNLFDFGNEISERFSYPEYTERAALETEIPRSVLLSLAIIH